MSKLHEQALVRHSNAVSRLWAIDEELNALEERIAALEAQRERVWEACRRWADRSQELARKGQAA